MPRGIEESNENLRFLLCFVKAYLCNIGEHINKRHNKTLLYHIVCPLKYRGGVITEEIGEGLKEICVQILERYELHFIEVGYEKDYVHF